jgi:hypothetical protein
MFKKLVIKLAKYYLRNEIEDFEKTNPEIKEFRGALYNKSINQFMEYGMEKLAGQSLDDITPIQLLKNGIKPLKDDVEGVILQFIDSLTPGK